MSKELKTTSTEQSVIDAMDTEFDGVDTFDIVQALLGLRARLKAADKEIALHKSGARMKELEGKNRDLRERVAELELAINDICRDLLNNMPKTARLRAAAMAKEGARE